MKEFTIRQAVAQDSNALLAMIKEHAIFERGQACITTKELKHIIAGDTAAAVIFVAVNEKILLGYAAVTSEFSLWRGCFRAHLDCLFVKDGVRSHGIGAALLGHVREYSGAAGRDRLEWQTPDWNGRAIAFYQRLGAIGNPKVRFGLDLYTSKRAIEQIEADIP